MPKREYNKPQPIYHSRRERNKAQKKKHSWLPILLMFAAFVLAAVAGAFFASSSLFDNKPATTAKSEKMIAHDKTIVMIMGVDERADDVGRSDTLMVATLDPKKKKAALLSIPRDTRVKIKGYGFDKINAAYAYGGYKLTQDTVENLLGVEMEHYVLINVNSFKKIIDAIGGVDINVEKRMYYEDPWDDNGGLYIDLYPGQQHMDGDTAITYVRYRDEEGDIGRIARQQKFMQAVMDKVTSPSIIPRLPSIIGEVIDSVETDLSLKQMIEFVAALKEAQTNGLQTEMLAGRPVYIDEISYWIPDLSKLRTTIANTLDVQISSSQRTAILQEELEYESSVPERAQEIPMDINTRKKLGLDDDEDDISDTKEGKSSNSSGKDAPDILSPSDRRDILNGTDDSRINSGTGSDSSTDTESGAAAGETAPGNSPVTAPSATLPSAGKTSN